MRRRGVAGDDVHDLVQETLARALALPKPPRDATEWMPLAKAIARNVATDHFRRRASRQRYDLGPYANPDDRAARSDAGSGERDAIDLKRQIAMMREQLESGELSMRSFAIVQAVSEDVPQDEIAEELGLGHQTVRNELCRVRRWFGEKWCARGAERRG